MSPTNPPHPRRKWVDPPSRAVLQNRWVNSPKAHAADLAMGEFNHPEPDTQRVIALPKPISGKVLNPSHEAFHRNHFLKPIFSCHDPAQEEPRMLRSIGRRKLSSYDRGFTNFMAGVLWFESTVSACERADARRTAIVMAGAMERGNLSPECR